jgi:hypothetical protein
MLAAYHGHGQRSPGAWRRPRSVQRSGPEPLAGVVFKTEPAVMKALVKAGADAAAGQPSSIETARMFDNSEMLALLQP